jgi:hypothetical protein
VAFEISEILVPHLGKTVGIHGVSAESPRRERETDGMDNAARKIQPGLCFGTFQRVRSSQL